MPRQCTPVAGKGCVLKITVLCWLMQPLAYYTFEDTPCFATGPPNDRVTLPTSRSGNASFSRRMVRCDRPFLLKASSAVEVFRRSGVCAWVNVFFAW